MGCGMMAVGAADLFRRLALPVAGARGSVDWNAVGLAVAAGVCVGLVLGRWARNYADRLDAGAPPTARTLWVSLADAPFWPWQPARDGATAALLGSAAGVLASDGGAGFVPLILALAALAWIDARSGLLPDALTLPLMAAGWLWGAQGVVAAAGASALVWAGLASLAWLYCRVRGRDGFGGGDVKCLAALAGWLGWEAMTGILWLACVLGLAWALVRRGGWHRSYPFGPCIALAAGAWLLAWMCAAGAVQS